MIALPEGSFDMGFGGVVDVISGCGEMFCAWQEHLGEGTGGRR